MAKVISDVSRTFSEYLLLPGLTKRTASPAKVSLCTPISRYGTGETPRLSLNIPFVSASMQAVSGVDMATALARKGGAAFIFASQSIDDQAAMVRAVKKYKAGFVLSDTNATPDTPLSAVLEKIAQTGHSTVAVTDDGSATGRFLGIVTDKDYWVKEDDLSRPVSAYMTPVENVYLAHSGVSLHEANCLLRKYRKDCLPVINAEGHLDSLVFRKDFIEHTDNPLELIDSEKRLIAAAGINTHDYKERVPALVAAGVDVLTIDSSDGYSEYQRDCALWIREKYGDSLVVGGGNVVSADGFRYLAEEAQLDFVKVGIGGGSICITREQKGIGRGQASAVLEVAAARDEYYEKTGVYVPICSDGGLSNDTQIIIATAMGADFVMMGRYFAMTDESPTEKLSIRGQRYKAYWGEGSNRARNWQRYSDEKNSSGKMKFEEGVDAYVPASGPLSEVLDVTLAKLRSTMCNVGADSLKDFSQKAVLTRISEQSFVEGGTSNVVQLDQTHSEG
ncbi:IMP dehydrogenase [Chitinivibrio alkaliphilus]|uniref:IMP dehydrogenase/GMP reductase n=1 Tax=Chitinivibrio alkaliphilus ACht1 TaxID=1313304 RepID=U7DAC0_9BACT|nr:IMP dehydrogenase [Chitinivibrio alkaliphilus]ERP31335.1 IMP dehydrogenase/GMP reductase [Chitinivibrio alkaliphilus ACht1]